MTFLTGLGIGIGIAFGIVAFVSILAVALHVIAIKNNE